VEPLGDTTSPDVVLLPLLLQLVLHILDNLVLHTLDLKMGIRHRQLHAGHVHLEVVNLHLDPVQLDVVSP
jgi:hypothetical protein